MAKVRKTWLIDQALVEKARKICGTRTETEAVTRALEEIVARDEIDKAFRLYSSDLADLEIVFPDSAK